MLFIYILSLGIALIIIGAIELALPEKIFGLWKKWIYNKLFFLHGILLVAAGLPLTIYRGALSGILFVIGIIPVLSGPFILLYPEKIRKMFMSVTNEINDTGIKKIIYTGALLRIAAGATCVASFFLA